MADLTITLLSGLKVGAWLVPCVAVACWIERRYLR